MNASTLLNMIYVRYPAPEYATFVELANGTGFGRGNDRFADAVAMSLWPSRGLLLHGFEIKVTRSDLRKELEDPTKWEAIGKYCHHWWLVMPEDLMSGVEIPKAWGVLVPRKNVLHVAKKAPALKPKPLTMDVMAAMLRRASSAAIPTAHLAEVKRKHVEEIEQRVAERLQVEVDSKAAGLRLAEMDRDRLRGFIDEFQRLSGVDITQHWNLPVIGGAVAAIVDVYRGSTPSQQARRIVENLSHCLRDLERMRDSATEMAEAIEAVESDARSRAATPPEAP